MQVFNRNMVVCAVVGMVSGVATAAPLVIDNADDVSAAWTVGGTAVSSSIGTGVAGNGRVLTYDPNGATGTYSTLSTPVTGNLSAYKDGTIELNYRTLGKDVAGTWTPTNGYPRFLRIDIVGGSSSQYTIVYEALLWTNNSGLAWDMNQNWHSLVLQLPEYNATPSVMRDNVRAASLLDGVTPTASVLPTIALLGVTSAADLDALWANVTNVRVGVYTHLGTAGGVDTSAVAFDNITLVPEPASLGLIGIGAMLLRRRRDAH